MRSGDEHSAFLAESESLMLRGSWPDVRRLMHQALAQFPDDPEFCLRYATAVFDEVPAESVEYARRATASSEAGPALLTRAGLLLYRHGQIEDAGRCARRVASHEVDENFPLIADFFYLIGLLAIERSRLDVAEEYLRLAFEAEPEGEDRAYRLAALLADQDRLVEASDVIARGLEHGAPDRDGLLALRERLT
jgi:tetratricopeptide (TPR) repeat protein